MTSKVNYTDAPVDIERFLEGATVIDDFLPSPDELVRKVEREKITLAVDKRSLALFKAYAKKHDAKYQNMMNGVISAYADKFLSHK
jgi:hypothetical protein